MKYYAYAITLTDHRLKEWIPLSIWTDRDNVPSNLYKYPCNLHILKCYYKIDIPQCEKHLLR